MPESSSLRSIAAMAALVASIAVGSRAQAQATASQPFVADDFFIALNGPDGNRLTPSEVSHFFNQARCNCQVPVQIYIALLESGIAKRANAVTSPSGSMSIVLGPGCNTIAGLQAGAQTGACVPIYLLPAVDLLDQTQVTVQTDANVLSVPAGVAGPDAGALGSCVAPNGAQFTQTINVNFDFDDDGTIDLTLADQVIIDLAPPPAPTSVTVQPAAEALVVDWTDVPGSVTDLLGYQILCSRADQYQVFKETATDGGGATGPFTAAFVSCPSAQTGMGVEAVDPTFVCSPLLSAGATSARIAVLQNGITYATAVVAVDQNGNASESTVQFGVPTKTVSFYDTYRSGDPPGGATGGLCAVGPGRPSTGRTWGGLSLLALGAAGLIRRRSLRRDRTTK